MHHDEKRDERRHEERMQELRIHENRRYADKLLVPFSLQYPLRHTPVNIPTRGPIPEIQQLGILTDPEHVRILPLYGRPVYSGSSQWNYFTSTDKFNQLRLPIHLGQRNCTNDQCSELSDRDEVRVPAYGSPFVVTLYNLDAPKYIPFV